MRWRNIILGAASIAALSLFLRLASTSAAAGGAMALDCNASVIGVQSQCAYPVGAEFSVEVYVLAAPTDGYVGFQAKLWWNQQNVTYLPTELPPDEALWPYCSIPARTDNSVTGFPSVLFACVPFPSPDEGFHDAGRMLQFRFRCLQDSYTELELIPRAGDSQLGTHFLDNNLAPVDPALTSAGVICGNASTPTPCGPEGCPTRTPRPGPPTPYPTPTPVPPVDLDLEASCSPDAISPDMDALLTCSGSITNRDDHLVRGAQIELDWGPEADVLPAFFNPIEIVFDGVPHDMQRFQSVAVPDLTPGDTLNVELLLVGKPLFEMEGQFGELLRLTHDGQRVDDALLDFQASYDALYPPTRITIADTLLTDYEPTSEEIPPPAAVEYEILVVNEGDTDASVTLTDRYSSEIAPAGAEPPAIASDESLHRISWDLGTLAPGEARNVRVVFASVDECSRVRHDVLVTALFGDVVERYVSQIGEFPDPYVVIGTNWDCVPWFTDDSDGDLGGLDPAKPTATAPATPTTAPESDDQPSDGGDDKPAAAVRPTEPPGESQVSALDGQSPANGESDPLTSAPAAQPISLPATGTGGSSDRDSTALLWALVAAAGAGVLSLYLLQWRLKR